MIGGLPDKRRQLLSIIRDVLSQVSAIIRDGQQSGWLRRDIPAENLAVALLGIIQPAAVLWSLSEGQFNLRQHADSAWNLYSRGILNE